MVLAKAATSLVIRVRGAAAAGGVLASFFTKTMLLSVAFSTIPLAAGLAANSDVLFAFVKARITEASTSTVATETERRILRTKS